MRPTSGFRNIASGSSLLDFAGTSKSLGVFRSQHIRKNHWMPPNGRMENTGTSIKSRDRIVPNSAKHSGKALKKPKVFCRWRVGEQSGTRLSACPTRETPKRLASQTISFNPARERILGTQANLRSGQDVESWRSGVPGGENMLANPNGSVRYFTVRESARLQTFPDWYVFSSSWTESMRQIGNAVPVRLATVIGTSVPHTWRTTVAQLGISKCNLGHRRSILSAQIQSAGYSKASS